MSFAVPKAAIRYWADRLDEHRIAFSESQRFGEQVLSFADPDGLTIELMATANAAGERAYAKGSVIPEFAIHGFHSATLTESDCRGTAALLTDSYGVPSGPAGREPLPVCSVTPAMRER